VDTTDPLAVASIFASGKALNNSTVGFTRWPVTAGGKTKLGHSPAALEHEGNLRPSSPKY